MHLSALTQISIKKFAPSDTTRTWLFSVFAFSITAGLVLYVILVNAAMAREARLQAHARELRGLERDYASLLGEASRATAPAALAARAKAEGLVDIQALHYVNSENPVALVH